jgi:hypothetical protein
MIADLEVLEPEIMLVVDEPVITYTDAVEMRTLAERACDVNLYMLAAHYFDVLDMSLTAQRCRDRANHYGRS